MASPTKLLWISPSDIEHLTVTDPDNDRIKSEKERVDIQNVPEDHPQYNYIPRSSFETLENIGRVLEGDWDLSESKFTDLHVYDALEMCLIDDVEWSETTYFELVSIRMKNGEIVRGCITPDEYLEKCKDTESLFNTIREEGFESQKQIKGRFSLHEIGVNIGRKGQFLFNNDGHHRLAIAKLLGLEKIPVLVIVRHRQWQNTRERIYAADHWEELTIKDKEMILQNHPDISDLDVPEPRYN